MLLSSFMLPNLIHGFGSGDARGGARVNSAKQVEYILSNPWIFTKIMASCFLRYINPYYADSYLTNMSYIGRGFYYELLLMLLVFLAFFDREKSTEPKVIQRKRSAMVLRIATYIGAVGAIILAMAALYVSFTSVGIGSILGLQGRYLLPLLFPVLYFTGIDGIKIEFNKNIMAVISIVIIMAVFFVNYAEAYSVLIK